MTRTIVLGLALLIAPPAPGLLAGQARPPRPPTGDAAAAPRPRPIVRARFELLANGVFVPVYVNGKGPFLFELDTGSDMSMVASETAPRIGIHTRGTMRGMGAGSGSVRMAMIPRLELSLPGGPVMSTTEAGTASMAGLWPLIARRIDGDLGYDVLKHYVVAIDYEHRVVALYDPATWRYDGRGTSRPFTLWGDYDPQIAGALVVAGRPPIPVRYTLDTGAGGVLATSPLVRSEHLRESLPVLPSPSHGIGNGVSQDLLARTAAFEIGPYRLDRPLLALSQDTVGSLAHASLGVNLGGSVLRRFTVIIDYPHQRLILEPNAGFREPFAADASGLVLEAEGTDYRTFVVRGVVPGSPASKAGFRERDVVAGIDGRDVSHYALWQLQDVLKDTGRTYRVTVRRGRQRSVMTLHLRSML
ncbi:MAG TPA: aspartyl protease family protein [Gemmatimonadales bacterium]|nr:aspartyl protease family protein [Gemmatimonadales bacterium]